MPPGYKPLTVDPVPEPILTEFDDAKWRHRATIGDLTLHFLSLHPNLQNRVFHQPLSYSHAISCYEQSVKAQNKWHIHINAFWNVYTTKHHIYIYIYIYTYIWFANVKLRGDERDVWLEVLFLLDLQKDTRPKCWFQFITCLRGCSCKLTFLILETEYSVFGFNTMHVDTLAPKFIRASAGIILLCRTDNRCIYSTVNFIYMGQAKSNIWFKILIYLL